MLILRSCGFAAALIAAIAVFVFAGPDEVQRFTPIAVEGSKGLVDEAVADYEANTTAAGDDVVLQQIANGWITRDLLYVETGQLDAISDQIAVLSAQTVANAQAGEPDNRIAALLLIGVITLAFHAATVPFVTPDRLHRSVIVESADETAESG